MAPIKINGYHHGSLAHIPQPEDPNFDTDYILVECQHHLTPTDIADLEAAGAKVLTRQGNDDTYLCRHTAPVRDGLRNVEALPFVKVARIYHESLVISPPVIESLEGRDGSKDGQTESFELDVHLHSCAETGADIFHMIREHIDPEIKMVMSGDTFLRVKMRPCLKFIKAIARIDHVRFISLPPVHTFDTCIATLAMTHPLADVWNTDDGSPGAFRGEGEVIGVIDSGFADGTPTGHGAFQDRVIKVDWADPALQDPTKPASLPADTLGHGTAVAGCAVGNSQQSFLPNAVVPPNQDRCRAIFGTAPQAALYAVRITDWQDRWIINRDAVFSKEYVTGKSPRIWNTSVGSRVQDLPNSTLPGYAQEANQTDTAANVDLEQIIVQSAGNDGLTWPRSPAGRRVFRQMGDAASAKNIITVGATANNRWEYLVSKKFGSLADPTQTTTVKAGSDSCFVDGWAETDMPSDANGKRYAWDEVAIYNGCISRIASESSKGPTEEGRIKPDLVCPGYGMLTARSPAEKLAEGFNACPFPDYKFAGGTSCSAPMVAGLAAAVRQALRAERGLNNPEAATVKAILINGARDLGGAAYPREHTSFDWQYPELIRKPTWITMPMPPAPNAAQGFGLPDLDRSLVHLLSFGDYHELVISNTTPGLKLTQPINLPQLPDDEKDDLMLRVTLVWTDPPGALMINKLKLGLLHTDMNGSAITPGPDPVNPMWWELRDQDRPRPEPYPNVQRITLNNPYDFTQHHFTVEVAPGTAILPFNHNGNDVRVDQPVSVVWAMYEQGT